jgi:hypothetical protein
MSNVTFTPGLVGYYTLTIRGQGSQTGDYSFAVYDVSIPTVTPITVGQTVDGEITIPKEKRGQNYYTCFLLYEGVVFDKLTACLAPYAPSTTDWFTT